MTENNVKYDSLAKIAERKAALQQEIENSNLEIKDLWGTLFAKEERRPTGPVQNIMRFASKVPPIIDGAWLGWKLYRKFHKKK